MGISGILELEVPGWVLAIIAMVTTLLIMLVFIAVGWIRQRRIKQRHVAAMASLKQQSHRRR